jgi:hypothetical protein
VSPLRLVLVLAVLAAALATPAPLARAQDAVPEPGPAAAPAADGQGAGGGGGLLSFLPDPKAWAAEVFEEVLVALLRGVADALRGVVAAVMGSALNFVTQTPPAGSYASPTVGALWDATRGAANAALALIAAWGGINLIVREHVRATYHDAMELVPRLVVGALLVNTSRWWAQLAIDANNALCAAAGQTSLPAWERADTAAAALMDLIAALVYLVAGLVLLLQMLTRLALVDVLIVLAPIALACWVLPQTQGWARAWSHAFVATVFAQFAQVLTLKLGASLLTELAPMAADAAVLALFLGVAVIALTLKVPGLLRADVPSQLGFVRYQAYRSASIAVAGGRGGGGRNAELDQQLRGGH